MTVPNVVVFSGHGLPMRIPVHVVPGMRHLIEWEIVDELDDPVDLEGTTWSATMHDAISGEQIYAYTDELGEEPNEHVLTFTATGEQTALLDPAGLYEYRVVRELPGPDMLAAGPVVFDPYTVPTAA